MLFYHIVLHIHDKLQKDRSISAVYHLLQGKNSIQTIQDTHLFQLRKYFGIYKKLRKKDFDKAINDLTKAGYLEGNNQERHYSLTKKASIYLAENESKLNHYHFNGGRFKDIDQVYFERLLLLTQVWTNSYYAYFKFMPVIENMAVEKWVKQAYAKTRDRPSEYLQLLFHELKEILLKLPQEQAEVFTYQLSGYKEIGKTIDQIAQIQGRPVTDVMLMTISTLHTILEKLHNHPVHYPVLHSFTEGLQPRSHLTHSAKMTEKMLAKGLVVEQIAISRKLTINTIYDHIVEIALNDVTFDISRYVTNEEINEIIQATQILNSFKLKEIKAAVREEIDYFKIRLVLARLGD